jgi:hypothetical protein
VRQSLTRVRLDFEGQADELVEAAVTFAFKE